MNKRTITIDQLIREEHLKLQKENYIKNLIQKVVTELQEQNTPFTIDALNSTYKKTIKGPLICIQTIPCPIINKIIAIVINR